VRAALSAAAASGRTTVPSYVDRFLERGATPLVQYAVNVTNTGSVDSDDVVLGFLHPPGAVPDVDRTS
jgi:hypothetical protein